ncbi:hypothetical protein [Croceivirga lutea]|uniref:hypothetical protein n=1 Tax=Croceivirga lutea TaxID=1775167 RepID=UPI00163ADE30|nr:hypothetical protein [Croceivirga lutea]
MTTFFGILTILLAINAILLIFSVNGAKESFRRTFMKVSENAIPKALPKQISEPEYKKAV